MNAAISKGKFTRGQNPASNEGRVLYIHRKSHHPHLEWEEVPEFLEKVSLNSKNHGIYNLGSKGGISKGEFIDEITSKLGIINPNAIYSSIDTIPMKAQRPKDMRLDSSKFEDS